MVNINMNIGFWRASSFRLLIAGGWWLASFSCFASPLDSLRTETINGKQFIIHQVDPKETLYSISKRYGVTVALLIENNPKSDGGLSVGQELKIPHIAKAMQEKSVVTHKVAAKETLFSIAKLYQVSVDDLKKWNNLNDNSLDVGTELIVKNSTKAVVVAKMPERKSLKGVHTVMTKETLFSISKMYGATIQQLKSWNNLTSDEVKPGQVLYVLPPMSIPEKSQPNLSVMLNPTVTETKKPIVLETVNPKTIDPIKPSNQDIKISENVVGSDEIHETGLATLIEGTDGNRKYLAQHKTAKVGTIMKVRSDATKREVFVRVIGPLAVDDGSVIKISKSAYDRIGATDARFNVELIYYK